MRLSVRFLIALALSRPGIADTVRPNLAYSIPFGGSGDDFSTAIAADAAGNSYITGRTTSADFPVVHGFQARLGGSPLRVSADGGASWSSPDLTAAVLSLAVSPGLLWAGTNNGLYTSADSGKTWQQVSSLRPATVWSIVTDPANANLVFACTQSGVFRSQDAGSTWNLTAPVSNLGYSSTPVCYYLAASPASISTLLANFEDSIYRSTDGGASWLNIGMEIPYAIAFDPAVPNAVYALHWNSSSEQFAKSTDGGATWADVGAFPLNGAEYFYSYNPQGLAMSGPTLLAATPLGVFRSTDGLTWSATSITSPANVVTADASNPREVYANADRLYRSDNGGVDWSPVLSPAVNKVYMIAAGLSGPSTVFVGSSPPSYNIFLTKRSPDGKQIVYSTYLGGSIYDYPTGIAVDAAGNAYVTGVTFSPDFPATGDALQKKLPAPSSAFLAKISPDGGTLLYSTFLGGSTADAAYAIALDRSGNVYLTGWAGSADFPVTEGAFQAQIRQDCPHASVYYPTHGDAFVAKISADGRNLIYSTFLGGTCADLGLGIAVDPAGNAYVAGVTSSADFPTTKGVVQETPAPNPDYYNNTGFLAKLNTQGSGLIFATYVGGPDDVAQAVAVDSQGNAYLTGSSYGFAQATPGYSCGGAAYGLRGYNYGTSFNEFSIFSGGGAFLLKLDSRAASTLSLRFLGQCYDAGNSISLDPQGRVWFAGVSGTAVSDPPWIQGGGSVGLGVSTVQTLHPFQGDGLGAGFVAQASPDGGTLLYSSLLDWEAGVALDTSGSAYVAGATRDTGQPKQEFLPGYSDRSALALRIDADVSCPMTIEDPFSLSQHQQWGAYSPLVIAPGVIGYLTGSGLGPAQALGPQVTGGQVATSLGGTTLYFDGIPAPLLSVQEGKVEFAVPFELAGRSAVTVQAASNGSLSNAIRVPVSNLAVEILAVANQDGTANSSTSPAAQGSVVSIYAAGMGQTVPPSADGQINGTDARSFPSPVHVIIDTVQVNGVTYAGPAPGQVAGINQVSVGLPALNPGYHQLGLGFGSASGGGYDVIPLYLAK